MQYSRRTRWTILTGLTIFSTLIVTGTVSRGHTAAPAAPSSAPTAAAPKSPKASAADKCHAEIVRQVKASPTGELTEELSNGGGACAGVDAALATGWDVAAMCEFKPNCGVTVTG